MAVKKRSRPAVKGVATADRVLAVLTAFKKGDGTLSLAELSSRTGLVKSTIMRLAVSLEKHGLMARVADSSYRLDAEVFRLGMLYRQSFRLENFVRPVLEELVARLGETASFYVRRGDQRQCLFRVESPHLLRLHVREGDMLPMDSSATAQVLRVFGSKPLPAYALTLELPVYTARRDGPSYRITVDASVRHRRRTTWRAHGLSAAGTPNARACRWDEVALEHGRRRAHPRHWRLFSRSRAVGSGGAGRSHGLIG